MKPRIFSTTRLSLPLAAAVAALLTVSSASATPFTWTGATDSTWNTTGNWSGGSVPLVTDDLTILGPLNVAGALNINFNANNAAKSLIFTNTDSTSITNTTSGSNRTLTVGSGGITTGAGAVQIGARIANQGVNITLGAAQTWNIGAGGMTVSNEIAGAGTGITKTGAGNLTIERGSVTTFTGGLNVNGGTVTLDYANLAVANLINATNALQISNGALTLSGRSVAAAASSQTFASTSLGAGSNTINIAKGELGASATLNLSALTVASGSSTIFSPTTAWTTTASTTERAFISAGGSVPSLPAGAATAFVNAGVFHRVAGGAAGSLRLAAVNSSGQLLLKDVAGSLVAGTGVDPTGLYQYGADGIGIALTNTGASIYGLLLNATSNGSPLTLANSGTLTLNSLIQIKATEGVTINPGTGTSNLVIGSERNLVIAMDNTAGLTINAPIANNGSTGGTGGTASAVTIAGTNPAGNPGVVTFGGANTYSGATTITRGTLILSNALALQNTSGISMGNGTTLRSTVINTVINAPISITTAATIQNNAPSSGTNTRNLTLGGAITGTGNVTFSADGGTNSYALTILNEASSYTGSTTITTNTGNQMSLVRLGINNALPVTTALTLSGTATTPSRFTQLDLRGFNQEIAGLTGANTTNRTLQIINGTSSTPTGTLTINTPVSTSFTFSGKIGRTGTPGTLAGANFNLEKKGLGTQILSGINDLTGTTTVSAGKLVVEGSIAASAVTVSGTGTILASGASATVGNSLLIQSGAILAVGDAGNATTATATVTNATTFNNNSIFSWDINAAGTSYDKLVTTNVLGEGAAGDAVFRIVAADATFANTFWDIDRTWTDIFTTDGTNPISTWASVFGNTVSVVNSSFTAITPVDGAFSLSGSTLTWTAVPEPTSAFAGLLLATGLMRRRRA